MRLVSVWIMPEKYPENTQSLQAHTHTHRERERERERLRVKQMPSRRRLFQFVESNEGSDYWQCVLHPHGDFNVSVLIDHQRIFDVAVHRRYD